MIVPPPARRMWAISCFMDSSTPVRLVASRLVHCCSSMSPTGPRAVSVPALLTAISRLE